MKEKVLGGRAPAGDGPAVRFRGRSSSRRLGLQFIPPELREGLGEIEAAERGELPRLVELGDLRGAFHNHTTASDGHNTLAEMAEAAGGPGLELSRASPTIPNRACRRGASARSAWPSRSRRSGPTTPPRASPPIFSLASNATSWPTAGWISKTGCWRTLDYVVASVHSVLNQDEAAMTARIVRAIENPADHHAGPRDRPAAAAPRGQPGRLGAGGRRGDRARGRRSSSMPARNGWISTGAIGGKRPSAGCSAPSIPTPTNRPGWPTSPPGSTRPAKAG